VKRFVEAGVSYRLSAVGDWQTAHGRECLSKLGPALWINPLRSSHSEKMRKSPKRTSTDEGDKFFRGPSILRFGYAVLETKRRAPIAQPQCAERLG
jgi:hypothetical protein